MYVPATKASRSPWLSMASSSEVASSAADIPFYQPYPPLLHLGLVVPLFPFPGTNRVSTQNMLVSMGTTRWSS